VLYGDGRKGLKGRLAPLFHFPHQCMYDEPRLAEILGEIGFDASPREAFDSDIEGIDQVELPERTENSVILEGRKR
jgi:hypothetical protein